MFGIYDHPATRFVCRHCGKDAGYDPEACFRCGPICGDCFDTPQYPCQEQKVTLALPTKKQPAPDYSGA
jgi:hypothetical protein